MLSLCSLLPSDHVFLCFAASLVAAACVACSRLVLHLSPTWPPRLQLLTGYTWDSLIPCVEKLLMYVPLLHGSEPTWAVTVNVSPWFPARMTATWRRPAKRRASSSGLCRPRLPSTVQARQQMWPNSCSALEDSTRRRLHSWAWPPTPDHRPTSLACRLPASASTTALRPSQPPWSPSPAYPAGPTKSVCTTAAALPASTDDLSRCCQFFTQEMYYFFFVPPERIRGHRGLARF